MRLDEWMAHQKLSDEILAQRVNVTRATISRIRRKKQKPSVELATRFVLLSGGEISLAEALGIGSSLGEAA